MRIFDLHCDTLCRCVGTGEKLLKNAGQLDLTRDIRTEGWVQTFACFVSNRQKGEEAVQAFEAMRRVLADTLEESPDKIALWQPGSQPQRGICSAVLAVEGGQALGGNIENVARMKELGVAFLTLVWNGDNELASGGVGGMDRGLTDFGKECLREMNRVGIVPDISHLNDKGIADVFACSGAPVMATHSNLRSVCGHPRNLTEEQFRFLVENGGVCGLNFYPAFINQESDYTPDDFRRHLDRMLSLGGEHTVALGSDFDGAEMPSFLKGVESLYILYGHVVEWYGEKVADQLFYQNAADFAARSLG